MSSKALKARVWRDVDFLTSLRPFRNYRNLNSLNEACVYLRSEFKEAGVVPQDQTWNVSGNKYTNVIASYNPEKSKRLIVGAHYDVAGDQPGADDNASAVAGLLETARLLCENKPNLDYRIDLVAYCLEEPPYFATDQMGSYIHAKSLYEEDADVTGMICYEMIGYFSEEPGSQGFPDPAWARIYPDRGNFIIVVGTHEFSAFNQKVHKLMQQDAKIDVQAIELAREGLAGMSDQRSYWRFNYPALMINDTSFLRNPNYHMKSDTIDTLDFDKLTEVVNCCYRAVVGFNATNF